MTGRDHRLGACIEETLSLMAELAGRRPLGLYMDRLEALFRCLRETEDASARAEAEDLIWALWCAHDDEHARTAMHKAIGALAREDLDQAEPLLEELVREWPGWAEAWNKRATLRYLRGHNHESILDIRRTLELEPRHFGAISGFGQICLRAGEERSALIAFELALSINPNLWRVREAVDLLRTRVDRVVH